MYVSIETFVLILTIENHINGRITNLVKISLKCPETI